MSTTTRRTKRLWLAVLVVAASAVALPSAPRAVAAEVPDHVVHAGAKDPTDPRSMHMFEAFFPRHLRVHRGDRVRWEFPNQGHLAQAFHTVTFGKAASIPYVRPDEVAGTLAFDERAFFTTGCGRTGQPVCVISSVDTVVSSGTPIQHTGGVGKIEPFDAVIDLPVGTYTYFCSLHHPSMQGTVEVVAAAVPIDNPKPQELTEEIADHADHADATFAAQSRPTLLKERGRRVWTVTAGGATDGDVRVVTEAFLPSSLEIRAGDTVRWVMDGTAHAVTFPDTTSRPRAPQHATLGCEFDGRATGVPGLPLIAAVGSQGLPWCPPGGTIEMGVTPLAANQYRAPNDAITSPGTFHSSGIMIGAALPERMRGRPPSSGRYFPSIFEATFPVPGTYTYRCMIHWEFMGGSITVR